MYLHNFWKYPTFSIHSNQPSNKMVANDGRIKLTTDDVDTFQFEYCKCNKKF